MFDKVFGEDLDYVWRSDQTEIILPRSSVQFTSGAFWSNVGQRAATHCFAIRLEAIAIRLEAIASRLEAIATRLEAMLFRH